MSPYRSQRNAKQWPAWVGYTIAFFMPLALFALTQTTRTFADPDTFYHMKMALLLKDRLLIRDFPWLPFTTLAQNFADHHYLYHLLLIPFEIVFGSIIGMKVATAVFASFAVLLFYTTLRVYRVRYPLWYTCMLVGSSGFVFRLNLGKATALSVSVLLLSFIFWEKKQPWMLFALAWVYVWLYGGWPVLAVLAGSMVVGATVVSFLEKPIQNRKNFLDALRPNLSRCGAVLAGLATGVVINPFFPNNLKFYWEQIVQIALLNYQQKIGVGSEWYPASFDTILGGSTGAFVVFFIALFLLISGIFWGRIFIARRAFVLARMKIILGLFVLSVLFLALSLRSQRHVEYFVPFFMLFASVLADTLLQSIDRQKLFSVIQHVFWKKRCAVTALFVYLFAAPIVLVFRSTSTTYNQYQGGLPVTKYAATANWIRTHISAGAVIFHSDWDDFPLLFFHDDTHRYIAGLDPTFFYRRDPVRYWQWVQITTGATTSGAVQIAKQSFGAAAFMIEKKHSAMQGVIANDPAVRLAYEDNDAWVYLIQ